MNFIRGSHYPKAPAFADACDQLGVLLWSENCFWGGLGGTWGSSGGYPSNSADQAAFDTNVLASLTDMIRIHRNHPSIIAWSMGNEDFFAGPAANVIALLKKEVALTHQLDPAPTGRPAAIGGAQSAIGGTQPGPLGDVAGYNGDGTGYDNPGIPNMVTEYGSETNVTRPGSYDPGRGNLTVTTICPPNRRGAVELPNGACSITAAKSAPHTYTRVSSTTSVFRSDRTTGIEIPTLRLRRQPGQPRARQRGSSSRRARRRSRR